ncbi:MAG: peptidase MA family metallohydrolase [Anaerolineales bacterium]|nr:peptidase MA family metallohydrolase [Anaerolineales bacterium]
MNVQKSSLLWLVAVGLVIFFCMPPAAQAQSGLRIVFMPAPEYRLNEKAVFRLQAESDQPIISVSFFLRTPDIVETFVGEATFPAGNTRIEAVYELLPDRRQIRLFAPVEYWWVVRDAANREIESARQRFIYTDNRFSWQSLSEGPLTVHWYEGEREFGQRLLDIARAGLRRANRDLLLPTEKLPPAINIYVYSDLEAARPALGASAHLWADGHANPIFGAVVVAGSLDGLNGLPRLDNEIPHELTHLLIYQIVGANYRNVPQWLNEGLAMMAESAPEALAASRLANAQQAGELLPLQSLCAPFPADPAQAQLAYFQSESVVRYIQSNYGSSSLRRLLEAAADGLDCNAVVQRALGFPLAELERRWREQTFSAKETTPLPSGIWASYLLLTALVTFGATAFLMLTLFRRPRARMI